MTETACGGTCMQPDDKTAGRVGIYFKISSTTCFVFVTEDLLVFAHTICPRSLDAFYMVNFQIEWVNTSWTYSRILSL